MILLATVQPSTKSKGPIRERLYLARERLKTLQYERKAYADEIEQAKVRIGKTGLKINKLLGDIQELEMEMRG